MQYTPELGDKINAALSERGAIKKCAVCGSLKWQYMNGFFFFPLQNELPNVKLDGQGAVCAGIMCQNCGNLIVVNLSVLGLGEEIMKPEPESPPKT